MTRAERALHLVAGCRCHLHLRAREQEAWFRRCKVAPLEAEQQSEDLVFRHRAVVLVEKRCQALHASVELRVSREDGSRPRFAGDAPDGVVPFAEQGERRFLGNSIVHEQFDAAVSPRRVSELSRPPPGVACAQVPGGNYAQSAVGDVDFAPTLPA